MDAVREEMEINLQKVKEEVYKATKGLLEAAKLRPGQILVLGCSTSEIQGKRIGSTGSTDVAAGAPHRA